MSLFDTDYEYICPHCHEVFLGEHALDRKTCVQTLTCDECGNKFRLISTARIDIDVTVEKM